MEQQKRKHVCKFCKKSFPCGRSLGGHIRSHLPKPGYELRENPKKTWRSVAAADDHEHDHDQEDYHHNTIINSSFSSSSAETENPNPKPRQMNQNHGKRSRNNNSQSSVSEVVEAEQHHEQGEEVVVAMCLIMLSRDVGSWGGASYSFAAAAAAAETSAVADSNTSKSSKSRKRREKVQGNGSVSAADKKHESVPSGCLQKQLKMKGIDVTVNGFGSNDEKNKSKIIKMESAASGFFKDGVKIKEFEKVSENGISSHDQNKQTPESKRKFIDQSAASGNGKKASKTLEFEVSENGISSYDQKSSDLDVFDSEFYSSMSKRSKFECTTCNKVFHSYQALGGHRASHKKNGGGIKCSPPPLLKLEAEADIGGDTPRKQPQPPLVEKTPVAAPLLQRTSINTLQQPVGQRGSNPLKGYRSVHFSCSQQMRLLQRTK
ncbi:uncharacterized protein [Spinacia oleracea]|uniref:C2H2-type domain-containing protein n=1 Tax=Spinacia oleracea TaxID=3562 RepID=A0ABM3QS37_SPIOL|nr:uncharacterized protein LOC110789850 [Spinacia oleracea]XP_056686194.1 uncharacterized protein LOC110789850 [Spinacia oleracea]